jgi:FkbM family methyltransferase|tara:strand:- start:6413 stop:7132 length:720 start_codon:yes stop_codon:yes gene_type:complete
LDEKIIIIIIIKKLNMCEIHNEIQVIQQAYSDKKPLIIFDVGACNFHDSINLKHAFPHSEVYSFEPSLWNLNTYQTEAERRGIRVAPVAISNKDDITTFYNSPTHNGSGSTLKPVVKDGTSEMINHDGLLFNLEGYEVQTVRLDTFCELNNIPHIDYLHMDVQGAEELVVKGLGSLRPGFIFAETCEFDSYKSGTTLEAFEQLLFDMGYSIVNRFKDDTLYKHTSTFPTFTRNEWLPKI